MYEVDTTETKSTTKPRQVLPVGIYAPHAIGRTEKFLQIGFNAGVLAFTGLLIYNGWKFSIWSLILG